MGRFDAPLREVLRARDPTCRELDLSGEPSIDELARPIAASNGLLQRPVAVFRGRAWVARPAERILEEAR